MAVETPAYLIALRRMIRQAGVRVADADEPDLADLVSLRKELDAAIKVAVRGQLTRTSWAGIGAALGITRQSAWERFRGE